MQTVSNNISINKYGLSSRVIYFLWHANSTTIRATFRFHLESN